MKVEYYIHNHVIVATNFEYDEYKDLKVRNENDYYGDRYLKKLKIYDCKHYYSNSSGIENNKNFQIKTLSKMLKKSDFYKNI